MHSTSICSAVAHARLLLLLLGAAALIPWPEPLSSGSQPCPRFVSAQGNSIDQKDFTAAPAVDLDSLQSFLDVSDSYTGGKAKRRKSNAAFADVLSFQQTQLQTYYVNSAPREYGSFMVNLTPGGKNFLPKVRNQKNCGTCVAHAVGAALEAAVAAALQEDAVNWDISPQSLYYCTPGGRTCATGWDIADALEMVVQKPELVRPTTCGLSGLSEPDIGSWDGICASASTKCPFTDKSRPWLKCSYKSLSTFWQIQQHVRNHGAVVTRMIVYDDFKNNFQPSGRPHTAYPPYTVGDRAKKLYGHAVAIVGYNNTDYSWTILNSWGKCNETAKDCEFDTGITADGMFKIAMGASSVGSPEDTYGIVCEPQAGTDLDPHYVQPWSRQQRKPVTLLSANDRTNLSATCYGYTAQPGDTAASLADAFLVDLRLFARDNVDVWTLTTVTDVFEGNTTAELQSIVNTVKSVKLPGAIEPYFVCNKTDGTTARCDSTGGFGACLGINCTFFYSEQDVRIDPAGKLLQVCNISSAPGQFEKVAYFQDPKISQPRALRSMLDILSQSKVGPVPDNYCSEAEWEKFNGPVGRAPTFTDRWVKSCDADGYVTELDISITKVQEIANSIDTTMLNALLTLEKLEKVYLVVKEGELPPQLGALTAMNSIKISYKCMSGLLPTNWGRSWRNIQYLSITQYPSDDGSSEDVGCGIIGQVPTVWGGQMKPMLVLDLSGNALTGPLPTTFSAMAQMQELYLQNNRFDNKIPRQWKMLSRLTHLDLSGNLLTGAVPLDFDGPGLTYGLEVFRLDDNRGMTGCVPLGSFTRLSYSNTGITGLCSATRLSIEAGQVQVVNKLLSPLLNADGNWTNVVTQFINRNNAAYLKEWITNGQSNGLIPANDARGTLTMALTIIDGTTYITSVRCTGGGMDLSVLPAFVKGLPRLDTFSCIDCTFNTRNTTASSLPANLPDFAHAYFKTLTIGRSRVVGKVPASWGGLQYLTKLELYNNSLTGLLPAELGNMPSLTSLNLAFNRLRGNLPQAWGTGRLPSDFQIEATGNTGLTGSVPSTWARFTGSIRLEKTGIKGCVPDQLVYSVYKDDRATIDMEDAPPNDPCSALAGNPYYTQVVTLRAMRNMLDPNGTALDSWKNSTEFVVVPEPGLVPPFHCRTYVGVKCDATNKVIELDLSKLAAKGAVRTAKASTVNLVKLAPMLLNLPQLQVLNMSGNAAVFQGSSIPAALNKLKQLKRLDMSGCGLTGPLPGALASLQNLELLDLSMNAGLSSRIPDIWAGMSSLRYLDLSQTGVTGPPPESLAALQQLQVLQAANTKLTGQIPAAYGILGSLTELDVSNANLVGSIPGAWADATVLRRIAVGQLQHAQRQLQQAAAGDAALIQSTEADEKYAVESALTNMNVALAKLESAGDAVEVSSSSGLGLLQLQVLRLQGNKLAGSIPGGFAVLSELREVSLARNRLVGPLPVQWAALRKLQMLDLSRNNLTGRPPLQWARLSVLQTLDLSRNRLSGQLQSTWASMVNVQQLSLGDNLLTGTIPGVWFSMKSAVKIDLSLNLLTGKFPAIWGAMADRATYKLRAVDVSDNVCMTQSVLAGSVKDSGIERGAAVTVALSCCSSAATAKAPLCKK